jgi:hypothetical protein
LPDALRAKLEYRGYDISEDFAREARRTAEGLGLRSHDVQIGDLSNFDRIYEASLRFDFITLTNTVHEVRPSALARVIVNCVERLSVDGSLFIYDMETIDPPELGAVTWSRDEVEEILRAILRTLGVANYEPPVSHWPHRICSAWHAHIQRSYLGLTAEQIARSREQAVTRTVELIQSLLARKLDDCRAALESLTVHGAGTPEEQTQKLRFLFDYWALSRALRTRE